MDRRSLLALLAGSFFVQTGVSSNGPPSVPPGLAKKTRTPTPLPTDTPTPTLTPTGTPVSPSLSTPTAEVTMSPTARTVFMINSGINLLSDNFNDNTIVGSPWTLGFLDVAYDPAVTVSEASGQLQITPLTAVTGAHYSGYLTSSVYDLTAGVCYTQVVQSAGTDPHLDTQFEIGIDSTHTAQFSLENGTLYFQYQIGSGYVTQASVVYSASTHAWWRFREAGGSLFWDTSADTLVWTNQASVVAPFALSSIRVNLNAGTWGSVAAPGTAIFDNVNVVPSGQTLTLAPILLSATELANPQRGQYEWFAQGPFPGGWPARDQYRRIAWFRIETSQDVYNWTLVDDLLNLATASGGRANLAFKVIDPSDFQALAGPVNTSIPAYVASADNGYTTTISGVANFHVPDWNNNFILTRWEALWAAFAAHYAGNKRFGFFDVGFFANFGEWEPWFAGPSGQAADPTNANWDRIINAVYNNRLTGTVQAPIGGYDPTNLAYPIGKVFGLAGTSVGGYSTAGFGQPQMASDSDMVQEAAVSGITTRWQSALVSSEWNGNNPDQVSLGVNQVLVFHTSALASGPTGSTTQASDPTNWATMMKSTGYRFQLDSMTLPTGILRNQPFTVTTSWENVNVAPFYRAWPVYFQLRSSSGGTVVYQAASGVNLGTLQPTQQNEIQRIVVGSGASSGSFTANIGGSNTASIAFNASPATVQTAIGNLIGAANVACLGDGTLNDGHGWGVAVIFKGTRGNAPQSLMTITNNTVAGGTVTVSRWQAGLVQTNTVQNDTFTVPGSVAAGTYTVAIQIPDADGIGVPLQLASAGQQADGSYTLGTVTVG